jgi:uncharacterized membrane protein YbhN (UPF0104 family)
MSVERHSLLRPAPGVPLFASSADEARARRPTDAVLVASSLLLLLLTAVAFSVGSRTESALSQLMDSLPAVVDALWRTLFWVGAIWACALVPIALVRHRGALVRDLVLAAAAAVALTAGLVTLVMDDGRSLAELLVDPNGPAVFPMAALAVVAGLLSTASPHLTRPFRHFGRWLTLLSAIALVGLGATTSSGALGSLAVGLLTAGLVHLAFGSPGGRPTRRRIELALQGLGVEVRELHPAEMESAGQLLLEGTDDEGPLLVKIYGRDAWDAQLLTLVWRRLWYREAEGTLRLSRVQLVEHEAFVTLLAERAGVSVPRVVTAGSAGLGDALVVVRTSGVPLSAGLYAVDEGFVRGIWANLRAMHAAGLAHGRVDLDRVLRGEDGRVVFGDLSAATVIDSGRHLSTDHAQLLGLSLTYLDPERAVAIARDELDEAAFTAMLPYVQEAAMAPLVRDHLRKRRVDLDRLRTQLQTELGVADQQLIKLRRVTWGSIFNLALLGLAAYMLIGLLGDIDFEAFVDAVSEASWAWLALALVLAQVPRVPGAVSTIGATPHPLPFGPVVVLQFAITYVNLAIPTTAARVAINVRFFQRVGVPSAAAVTAGAIDSVAGFVVQIGLFVSLWWSSDLDLDWSTAAEQLSGLATIALIAVVVVVVAAVVVLLVPSLRRRVMAEFRKGAETLHVLRDPRKLLYLFGGNLAAQVLFAVALGATARAFGYEIPLGELVLVNTVVSLFSGLLPIPGGIGVTEGGITLGLTRLGVPAEIAFAIAIAYRFASFYLPPIWGFGSYRWLIEKRYL